MFLFLFERPYWKRVFNTTTSRQFTTGRIRQWTNEGIGPARKEYFNRACQEEILEWYNDCLDMHFTGEYPLREYLY